MRSREEAANLHRRVLDWIEFGNYTQGCAADAIGVSDSLVGKWVRCECLPGPLDQALIEQDILELRKTALRRRRRELDRLYA